MDDNAWLVVIDGQRIFADPQSDWGSPMWPGVMGTVATLLPHFAGRTILTRWIPPTAAERVGSWRDYMEAWPFADRPRDDAYFALVDDLAGVDAHVIDAPTFGKWDAIRPLVGEAPSLVVAGVSTDCCVVSTVLPAADAGARVTVVTDACAGSTLDNHAAALTVMGLYPPQVRLTDAAGVLGEAECRTAERLSARGRSGRQIVEPGLPRSDTGEFSRSGQWSSPSRQRRAAVVSSTVRPWYPSSRLRSAASRASSPPLVMSSRDPSAITLAKAAARSSATAKSPVKAPRRISVASSTTRRGWARPVSPRWPGRPYRPRCLG
ncbi:cysteine hydrolase [Tessaracoccus sp. HDW20]|nr:cysteine hydrolase [Tessaracoccus coleopterorum]